MYPRHMLPILLETLQDTPRFQRGIVLYAGREVVSFGSELWAVPLSV